VANFCTAVLKHVRQGQTVKTETETIYLISSLNSPDPKYVLQLNRDHWKIEIMHRDKDVLLGEDRYTNRSGHPPRNIFTLTSAARTLLKRIAKSPTRAIEIVKITEKRPSVSSQIKPQLPFSESP